MLCIIIGKKNKNTFNSTYCIIHDAFYSSNAQVDNEILEKNDAPVVKTVNVGKNKKVPIATINSVPNRSQIINKNTTSDDNDDEDKKRKNLVKKLRAYKKAYKCVLYYLL